MKFEYLLRIDALSTPVINSDEEPSVNVEEDASMPGFIRLKIRATVAEQWAEFLGSGGRIRRDLIKAKVASLLAISTRQGKFRLPTHFLKPTIYYIIFLLFATI